MSRFRRLLAILCVLLVASSCGVPEDTESSALDLSAIPESLRPGQLSQIVVPVVEGATQPIYLVGPGNVLIVVLRTLEPTQEDVIASLLLAETQAERNVGIETAITRGTEIVSVDVPPFFQEATVTLTPDSLSSSSGDRQLGFAQIVFTLTELENISAVSFQTTTGDLLRVQTDTGLKEPGEAVRRADFASLDPGRNLIPAFPNDDDVPSTPEPTLAPNPVEQTIEVPIWIVNQDNQLVPVTRRVERSPAALMQTLLDGPLEVEKQQGFDSAIEDDALARSVEVFTVVDVERGPLNTAVVDLVPGSLPPFEGSDARTLAVAQMVYTLTGLVEIDQVLFSIDGVQTAMPTQLGLSEEYDPENPGNALTRSDYSVYALAIKVVEQPVPTPGNEATPIPLPTPSPVPTPEPTPTQTP